LVETKRIGAYRSFKLLARFLYLLSYSKGMFEYPEKSRFPSKPDPTLKDLLIMHIIFDLMGNELQN